MWTKTTLQQQQTMCNGLAVHNPYEGAAGAKPTTRIIDESNQPVCLDHLKGVCQLKRQKCKYFHPAGEQHSDEPRQVCEVYLLTGFCKFGLRCRDYHPPRPCGIPRCSPACTQKMTEISKQEAVAVAAQAKGAGIWQPSEVAKQLAATVHDVLLSDSTDLSPFVAAMSTAQPITDFEEEFHPIVMDTLWSTAPIFAKERLLAFVSCVITSGILPPRYLHRLFDFLHGSALAPDSNGADFTQLLQALLNHLPENQNLLHPTIISQYQQRLKILLKRHRM